MFRLRIISILLLLTAGATAYAQDLTGETIKACGDGAGWPPYTFLKDGEVKGYDVDVLNEILAPKGIDVKVEMPPWKRCLVKAKDGDYHIALSASHSKEREENYILTNRYYTLQPSYIYDENRYPDGPDISAPEDLLNYHACGLRGYNYDGFGIDTGKVDTNANTFEQVSQKTLAGRCDLFMARYEILVGFSLTGDDYLSGGLVAKPIPGIKGDEFYMMVSRAYAKKDALVKMLNEGIDRLESNGTLDELLNAYLPD